MKAVKQYHEISSSFYVVLPKIRELFKAMGNVIIVYDNGDKRTIQTDNAEGTIQEIISAIEEYYNNR